jgi:hypothetical protein
LTEDGLQWLAIVDATLNPVAGSVDHYGFREPGTWGLCPGCRFEVTLDEDGFIREHERRTGDTTKKWCEGGRKEPDD